MVEGADKEYNATYGVHTDGSQLQLLKPPLEKDDTQAQDDQEQAELLLMIISGQVFVCWQRRLSLFHPALGIAQASFRPSSVHGNFVYLRSPKSSLP